MRIFLLNLFLILLFYTNASYCYDIKFNITGNILNTPCIVDKVDTVNLGSFSIGNYNSANLITRPVPFNIILRDCPENYQNVNITFNGESYNENTNLLALDSGGATHIGIALYEDDTTTLIPINATSKNKSVRTEVENTFTFYASYTTTGAVTSGDANATMTFTMSYN